MTQSRRPSTSVDCRNCHKRLARVRWLVVPVWFLADGVNGKRIGGKEAKLVCPFCGAENRYDLKREAA